MNHDVLVIGGGWAGIAAAVEARRRGRSVTLVETHPYLGGRARSFVERVTGETIDNGQHVVMGCYHTFLATIAELGISNGFRTQTATRVVFVDVNQRRDVLDASKLPGRLGIAFGILGLSHVSLRGRMAALRFAHSVRSPAFTAVGLTCHELLIRERQTDDAIRRFWEPIILATLNAPMHKAAASLLVTVLRRAFFGNRTDGSIYIPTDGLSSLSEPLTSVLQSAGGAVMLSTAVDRLVAEGNRITSVVLSDGSTLTVSAVVCAIPQRSLLRLLEASLTGDSQPHNVYSEVEFSPIISVYLWYDRAWMNDEFVAALGTTIQWVFNRRLFVRAVPDVVERYPGHVSVTVSAASDLALEPIETIIEVCDRELRLLFSDMHDAKLLHGVVIKEKQATPLITPAKELERASAVTPWTNVALAGDWTDTGLPATLEGAALSGVRAVDVLSL